MPDSDYPADWPQIVAQVRARSGGRCECTGECGLHRGNRCEELDNTEAKWASGKVMLTTAHRNHAPADCRLENLMHMCNTCHLRYDHVLHLENQKRNRAAATPTRSLFEEE